MNINKKGYIYTLSAIILILILIFFILFTSRFTETEIEDITGKVRCDELHFFVEDTKVDLERGLMITGRRASIYAISNQIMGQNVIEPDYTFVCNEGLCPHCSNFNYSGVGAEAAIAELMFCGTLYGVQNEYMKNHTLEKWIQKLAMHAGSAGFDVNMAPTNFKVTPYSAFNFTSDVSLTVNISDATGMCYFSLFDVTVNFMTDLEGLEDPLYADSTGRKVAKAVHACEIEMHAEEMAEGTHGWGWVVGEAVRIDNMSEIYKLASADKTQIVVIDYDDVSDLLNGSYNDDLSEYGGIITNWNTQIVRSALDAVGIPYLTTPSGMHKISEGDFIISLASKYYFIDVDSEGYCTGSRCAIYHENGTCLVMQGDRWFSPVLQTCDDGHYPVGILFPETPKCRISPQFETNKTWSHEFYYPMEIKNIHLIASSSDTGDYNMTLTYVNETENISYANATVQFKICDHCTIDNSCELNTSKYDSHYVSKRNDPAVGLFKDEFWNVTTGACGGGETVQHIIIKVSDIIDDLEGTNYPLAGFSITDPFAEAENKDPVIWAITVEIAPMSIWKLNTELGNYTDSSLFVCYNLSDTGPSFFDRVEGNKVLTEKYRIQTNNTIGLESFLSIERFNYYGVNVSSDLTAMDYLYFGGNETGYPLIGTNETGIDYFRIDLDNAINYSVYDLIRWNEYTIPTYENCSYEGEYCQPTGGPECCGALTCFDDSFKCYNCLGETENCLWNSTWWDRWCCTGACSRITDFCCAASETNCSDGIDNDCNGDMDCCDDECFSESHCTAPENSDITFCNDSIDNDCNNFTDCNDASCDGICPYCPLDTFESICNNTLDDDCDTLTDCDDILQCSGCPYCPSAEVCGNGIDDDCDGDIDCEDSECPPCTELCFNDIDDDADTLIDCQDPDCSSPCTACQNESCSAVDYDWSCVDICAGIDTECGCAACSDCNLLDGCYGSDERDYYCSGISCVYSFDDCSDCSCSCGGYAETESLADGNCADGIDNDCDGDTDGDDFDCIMDITPPSISGVQQDEPDAWTSSSTTKGAIITGTKKVNVRASITDASGISSVKLYYEVSDSKPVSRSGFTSINMFLSGGYYQTVSQIPQDNNNYFWYYINATDTYGNWQTSPTDSAPPDFWTYYCG
ncbi:MAG: hypothetical protein A7316_09810 [Candidatus Altiarchaeales archaeon WOR_SM1_86-2]|nr:MAG: hypothetical protein A7316_09810 [Candidatus Altiarchaeales archaeon WOR_SM1_86-2]